MDRKSFLTTLGFGATGFFGALFGSYKTTNTVYGSNDVCSSSVPNPNTTVDLYSGSLGANGSLRATNQYGSMAHPPFHITSEYAERFYFPPNYSPDSKKVKNFDLKVFPLNVDIAHSVSYPAWTFDGLVPGPIISCLLYTSPSPRD